MRRLAIATIALGIMMSLSCAAMAGYRDMVLGQQQRARRSIDWSATASLPQFNTNGGSTNTPGCASRFVVE